MAIPVNGSGMGGRVSPQNNQLRSSSPRRGNQFPPIVVARTVLALLASCYLCGLYGQLYWTHRGGESTGEGHHGVHRHVGRALGEALNFNLRFDGGGGLDSGDGDISESSSSAGGAGDVDDGDDEEWPGRRWSGLHRGMVLSEFLDRVLSRRIAQSDVLVVAPDVNNVSSISGGDVPIMGPGGTVMRRAVGEGHEVHTFAPSINLTDHYFGQQAGSEPRLKPRPKPPGWILLAYLVPGSSSSSSSGSEGHGNGIDDVLHPSRFDALLSHSTMTYVVFEVGSVYHASTESVTDVSGLVAVRTLLRHKYKVQIMAVSHHARRRRGARDGVAGVGDGRSRYYGPNDLLTSAEEVEEFLVAGAEAAGEAAATTTSSRERGGANRMDGGEGGIVRFDAYLFATQGLDLAIPSRSTHLIDLGDSTLRREERLKNGNEAQVEFYETFGIEGEGRREAVPPLAGCPSRHDEIHLDFVDTTAEEGGRGDASPLLRLLVGETSISYRAEEAGAIANASSVDGHGGPPPSDGYQSLTIGGGEGGDGAVTYTIRELWLSRADDPHSSEAACVRVSRTTATATTTGDVDDDGSRRPMVSCATRVLAQRGEDTQPRSPPKPTATDLNRVKGEGVDRVKPTANLPPQQATRKRYNVLSILIDPISRAHFHRSLPRTSALLVEKLNFTSFERYTVVGGNSGPNQAALFSGVPLTGGREGISSSISHSPATTDTNTNKTGGTGTAGTKRWIWDRLRDEGGYATLKIEDGCVLNSNMVQSLQPNTTHGEQLQGLFCFDYDRPNCVGGELASRRALRYAERFVDAYSSSSSSAGDGEDLGEGRRQRRRQPWAAFLSFIDSHEDSMAVAGVLDDELHGFLSGKVVSDAFEDTLVMVLSDHGLHYGPYFKTLRGERERAQPILYLRLPDDFTASSSSTNAGGAEATSALRFNAAEDMWVTPFDVHETVLQVALGIDGSGDVSFGGGSGVVGGVDDNSTVGGGGRGATTATKLGSTLLRPLPESRRMCGGTPGVPDEYCRLLGDGDEGSGSDGGGDGSSSSSGGTKGVCTLPPRPPSLLSYYSDVPREHRPPPRTDNCGQMLMMAHEEVVDTDGNCSCSENGGDWHPCDDGVATSVGDPPAASGPDPFLRLTSCDGEEGVRAAIAFEPRRELVDRHASLLASRSNRPPNILVVNIDSSVLSGDAAAERHLPRTLRLLQRHQIVRGHRVDDGAGEVATTVRCPTGFCAARFAKSASPGAGPGGLPSVLTGCVEQVSMESSNVHNVVRQLGGAARRFRYPSFGGHSNRTVCGGGPTLFDVARDHGYVTFHADYFCKADVPTDASPDAMRNRTTDYTLKKEAFCRSTEEKASVDSASQNQRRCVDERSRRRIAFESVTKLWDTYSDVPLFAFLNTWPFDQGALDLADLVRGADEFDDDFSSFLEGMLARGDANNSIIVLHSSDHRGNRMAGLASFDYSFAVERLSPFTAIIVPINYSGLSISALSENQRGGRLVTELDLYHTLERLIESSLNKRAVISSRVAQRVRRESDLLKGAFADMDMEDGHEEQSSSLPIRSYDLLKSRIPSERSCSNAGIPSSSCPCMDDI